ncbi:hypothetical protein ACLKA6_002614 [Drosophila palustris]
MIQLHHSHTGIYIKEKIINILQDYDIELDQIFSITSDNGKNMIKAIEILNDETEESQESQESLLDDEKTEDDLMEKLCVFSYAYLMCQRFGHSLRKCIDAEPACLKCARSCFNCKGDHPAFWDRRPTLLEALRTRGLSRRSPRSKSAIQSVGLLTSQSFQGSRIQRMLFSNTLPAAQVLSPAYQVLPPSAQDQPLASQVQPPAEYLDMEDDLDDFCDLVPIL